MKKNLLKKIQAKIKQIGLQLIRSRRLKKSPKKQAVEEKPLRAPKFGTAKLLKNVLDKRSDVFSRSSRVKEVADDMAKQAHESWAENFRKNNPDQTTRIKEVKGDKAWIEKNGTSKVDILNTPYDELPQDFKKENFDGSVAALKALNTALKRIAAGKDPVEAMEKASADVHAKWVERNPWADDKLKVPYKDLSEAEKDKDRDFIRTAMKNVSKFKPGAKKKSVPATKDPAPASKQDAKKSSPAKADTQTSSKGDLAIARLPKARKAYAEHLVAKKMDQLKYDADPERLKDIDDLQEYVDTYKPWLGRNTGNPSFSDINDRVGMAEISIKQMQDRHKKANDLLSDGNSLGDYKDKIKQNAAAWAKVSDDKLEILKANESNYPPEKFKRMVSKLQMQEKVAFRQGKFKRKPTPNLERNPRDPGPLKRR